jgi:5-methylcytosine-specific restriction protein A
MRTFLNDVLEGYSEAKNKPLKGNSLANKIRGEFPNEIQRLINDNRYKVVGSPGKGNWADCPWIAILDMFVTDTAQSGYYPVFLFMPNMKGVFLSLNQGVTEVKENYKRETGNVLRIRAENFRAKLDISIHDEIEMSLGSSSEKVRLYECGNIFCRYYSASNLPHPQKLFADIEYFISQYQQLTFNDTSIADFETTNAIERKKLRLHYRIERNTSISLKVKKLKGYKCEACGFKFSDKYGDIGSEFIEAHHLQPISLLDIGNTRLNLKTDFAVLCSNCHRMIHKLDDPSDIELLRSLLKDCC